MLVGAAGLLPRAAPEPYNWNMDSNAHAGPDDTHRSRESGELVLVAGASGYLGRHIVEALHERRYRVRALVRSRAIAEAPGRAGAPALSGLVDEWVEAPVTDPDVRADACRGAHRIVSALGVTRQKADPWDIDFRTNLGLLDGGLAAGARSFLYAGVMGMDAGTSTIMRSKAAFAAVLERSALTHQIVHPSAYFSDMGEFLAPARRGIGVLPPDPDVVVAPIHGADLAAFCVDRMGDEAGVWDVRGPEALTYRQVSGLALSAAGRSPRSIRVPRPAVDAGVWLADRWGSRPRELARFLADGMRTEAGGTSIGRHRLGDWFRRMMDDGAKADEADAGAARGKG